VVVFILILLLLAAMTGVLGAVLKITLILVLSFVLTMVLLAWIGIWYAKRRYRAFQHDAEMRAEQARRRRTAYDVGAEPSGRSLGDGT
jgi:hypothetical protein